MYRYQRIVLLLTHAITLRTLVNAESSQPSETTNILEVKDFKKLLASEDEDVVNILFSSDIQKDQLSNGMLSIDPSLSRTFSESNPLSSTSIICDTNISKTGGKRKDDLCHKLNMHTKESIITILNSDIKSCYMVYTTPQNIEKVVKDEDYMIMPMDYNTKIRKNAIKMILDPKRSNPIKFEIVLFAETGDGDEVMNEIVEYTKSKILNEMEFLPMKDNRRLNNNIKEEIVEICASSYNELEYTLKAGDMKKLSVDTTKMKNHILQTHKKQPWGDKITPIEIYQKCTLAFTFSTALQSNVGSIEIKSEITFLNDYAQYLIQNFTSKSYPYYDVGLNGEGEVLAISDTGIDVNNCYFWDSVNGEALQYGQEYIDLTQRKIVQYDNAADTLDFLYGHGTHTAGSMLGHRAIDGINESRGRANGIAYKAKVAIMDIAYNVNGSVSDIPTERLLNTGRPYAKIHSASWGELDNFYYTEFAIEIDEYMYLNDDFLYVVAGGNSGSYNRFNTVMSPGTAKNLITVGASESTGADVYGDMLGPSYVADFSSKGPTMDGRTKPDILAPGYNILSAGAQPDIVGECDPAGRPPRETSTGKDGLAVKVGTSMATPIVSGALALIRQYFREGYYPHGMRNEAYAMPNPSNALLKAVLLNGGKQLFAVDNIGGLYSSSSDPAEFPSKAYDNMQNYGLVSLSDSLYIKGKSNVVAMLADRIPIKEGQEEVYDVTIDFSSSWCTTQTLSVTIAWMDKPGFPYCIDTCLMNDIDLYITKKNENGGSSHTTKYYPNGNTQRDVKNTVERIRIENVSHGDEFEVHIVGMNFEDSGEVQNVALIGTGCFPLPDEMVPKRRRKRSQG